MLLSLSETTMPLITSVGSTLSFQQIGFSQIPHCIVLLSSFRCVFALSTMVL